MKETLIYGGGAIGSFLSYCLYFSGHKIFHLSRNEHYKACKKNGLSIKIYNNNSLKKQVLIKENKNFVFIDSIKKIKKSKKLDYIFITTKISENFKKIYRDIDPFIGKNTALIPPCTAIPFWWHECLIKKKQKKFKKKLDKISLKNIKKKNIIGMTMWLSGKINKPGKVYIAHIQRGLPVKEVFNKFKKKANNLRRDISKNCKSPIIKNIFSEIFIKSINSLAFNLIALKTEKNNFELNKDIEAKKEIYKILKEGDNILNQNKIKIFQNASSRIKQTLKSKVHTMSMLNAYKNNKTVEIKYLWRSFENLCGFINLKMSFTKKIFLSVNKKLS